MDGYGGVRNMNTINPTYGDIHSACESLYQQYLAICPSSPSVVVGLTRGGLLPCKILSHLFDVPAHPISYTSSVGNGGKTMYTASKLKPIPHLTQHSSILVVDDIADSGNTLLEVKNFYSMYHLVYTASIYYKTSSVIKPDIFCHELPEDGGWVIFPWEVVDDS